MSFCWLVLLSASLPFKLRYNFPVLMNVFTKLTSYIYTHTPSHIQLISLVSTVDSDNRLHNPFLDIYISYKIEKSKVLTIFKGLDSKDKKRESLLRYLTARQLTGRCKKNRLLTARASKFIDVLPWRLRLLHSYWSRWE